MREPWDQCIEEFTSKDILKDHNEKTMWSVYHKITDSLATYILKDHNKKSCDQYITELQIGTMWSVYDGIHKQIQIKRSQREDYVISV